MRAELHLARRYLLGLGRRTHVATVTLISLIGLTLGVLALVVTLALLEGFQASIRSELIARTTHARVSPAAGRALDHPDELASLLQRGLGEVEMVQIVKGMCLVSTPMDAVPASLVGRSDVIQASLDTILANRVEAGPGDSVQVISTRRRLTPMGPVPVRRQLDVALVKTPEPGHESGTIYLPIKQAQQLLWGRPVVEAIDLRDAQDPWGLGRRVRQLLGEQGGALKVEGLEELHSSLLLALALERVMIFVAVGLMLVVAALNLLCNVAMVAAEKRVDLSVLAGLGMAPSALRRLFLLLGLSIGVIASVVGAVLGIAIAKLLDATQLLPLPRGVFMEPSVPFQIDPAAVAAVLALALALALAASWLPARTIARREPAAGLRYE
jgi:lipoprotein-releasing system permease protein